MEIDKLNKFSDELLKEKNDRSAAIIAGIFIENLLKIVIENFLVKESPQEIWDFNGSLETFAGKINIAYALGLISEDEFTSFKVIKDIRNKCAHGLGVVDGLNANLAESPLLDKLKEFLPSKWIDKLSSKNKNKFYEARNNIFKPENAREIFNHMIIWCSLSLYGRFVLITNGNPKRREVPPMLNE